METAGRIVQVGQVPSQSNIRLFMFNFNSHFCVMQTNSLQSSTLARSASEGNVYPRLRFGLVKTIPFF